MCSYSYWLFRPTVSRSVRRASCIGLFTSFLKPFFRKLAYRSDPSTDFHAWWIERRGLAHGGAFWRFRWYCLTIRGWNPPNPNLGSVNTKHAFSNQTRNLKYWKFHVIEIAASIPTEFCTTINSTLCGLSKFGRNYSNDLTKLGTVTHIGS